MSNEQRQMWRVDLISKQSATPEQLDRLPKAHRNLRRFDGRVIGLLEQYQLCGNVPFDYIPTLAHYLPDDLKEFTDLFEPYLVFDTPRPARVNYGYENRSLEYRTAVCGDNAQTLRSFTEGVNRQVRLASKPGETVWHINVTMNFGWCIPRAQLWTAVAVPAIASLYEGRWYVDRAFWRNGQRVEPQNESWLIKPEEFAEFPWMLPLIEKGKDIIREDPRVTDECKRHPEFASTAIEQER
jgi:hypothetical protein